MPTIARLIVVAFLSAFAISAHALTFPPLTGRVVDEAGILDASTKAALEGKLADLEAKSTHQLVVATLRSLQGTSIEDYGYQLGRQWQIGQQGKNNGTVLIVAPNERKVRIEVGYGLEGTLTDAVSKLIIENGILPRFRANDYAGGIVRGVDDIISVLSGDAEEWKQRAASRPDASPLGVDIVSILILIVIIYLVISSIRSGLVSSSGRRTRRGGPWIIPTGSSGSSGWGGGSGGGSSGGGGGGFSGGGGSFGGGGSSGSW